MKLSDKEIHEKIKSGAEQAVRKALDKHKALGQSVVIQNNGKPEIIHAQDIPSSESERLTPGNSG